MPSASRPSPPTWQVEVFFDGDCPLCLREIALLQKLDRAGQIRFTNIAASGFQPAELGLSASTLMNRIHGRLPDGEIIEGVEVFRRLYAAVGFKRLVWLSRAPGASQLLDAAYALFAKNRLRLTGRCDSAGCALPGPSPDAVAKN